MMRLQPVIHRSQEAKRNNDIQQKSECWKETNIPIIWSHLNIEQSSGPHSSLSNLCSCCPYPPLALITIDRWSKTLIHLLSVSLMPLLSYCITGSQTILHSTHTDVPVLVEREHGRRRDERERVHPFWFHSCGGEVEVVLWLDRRGCIIQDRVNRSDSHFSHFHLSFITSLPLSSDSLFSTAANTIDWQPVIKLPQQLNNLAVC